MILTQPLLIATIAMPLLIQSYGIFAIAYGAAYWWRVPHKVAAPCAMIGTSNFFELAVAIAIGLFRLNSGAALVTVVGWLVEVRVMLSLVAFATTPRPSSALRRSLPPARRRAGADQRRHLMHGPSLAREGDAALH